MKLGQLLEFWSQLDPTYCYRERDGFWCGKEGQRLFVRSGNPEVFDQAAIFFQIKEAIADRNWNFQLTGQSGSYSAKVWTDQETTEFWVSKNPSKALLEALISALQSEVKIASQEQA